MLLWLLVLLLCLSPVVEFRVALVLAAGVDYVTFVVNLLCMITCICRRALCRCRHDQSLPRAPRRHRAMREVRRR